MLGDNGSSWNDQKVVEYDRHCYERSDRSSLLLDRQARFVGITLTPKRHRALVEPQHSSTFPLAGPVQRRKIFAMRLEARNTDRKRAAACRNSLARAGRTSFSCP